MYLLSGHGLGGRVLDQDGDSDVTAPNTHVSLDLDAGAYTIEATTYTSRVEGNFTLIAVDPPPVNTVVGEPYSRTIYLTGPWWSPWTHANIPRVQSVAPSPGLSLELTYRHTSTGAIAVTFSGTPTHAGDYTVTFAYLQGHPGGTFTRTIEVNCPGEATEQSDRTCLEDFVVAESDVPHHITRQPVTFAALKGMRQAADEWVGAFRLDCSSIPTEYRLTRNTLIATLVAIQIYEPGPSSLAPHSLMVLGRSDRYFLDENNQTPGSGNREVNKILYSLNDPDDDYGRAFWHPGVGLYQLDDSNEFGSKMSHAERAHARTSASTALEILHKNYCQASSNVSTEQQADRHLNGSLYPTWFGCERSQCFDVVDGVIEGGLFSSSDDSRNRLYLNVSRHITHEHGGGVHPRWCRWSTSDPLDRFRCFMYDITQAEGSVWLSGSPSGTSGRSPLAYPFLSFTGYLPDFTPISSDQICTADLKKFAVFRHEETGYTRTEVVGGAPVEHDIDLIAAPPCGSDVRAEVTGTGWWSVDEVGGAELLVIS